MKEFSKQDMLEFADWSRNGLTNLEYSDIYNSGNLLKEWQIRKGLIKIKSN